MCLSIPGRITGFDASTDQLAVADVLGTARTVNVGMLTDGDLAVGDWVLVHLGFAIEVVDEQEARAAEAALALMARPDGPDHATAPGSVTGPA